MLKNQVKFIENTINVKFFEKNYCRLLTKDI